MAEICGAVNPDDDTLACNHEPGHPTIRFDAVDYEHAFSRDGHVLALWSQEPQGWQTKDSGERAHFDSGMQRDTEAGKPRFDLMLPEGVPYEDQMLTRLAGLLGRGAVKYDARNWEQANSKEELARMKSSAFRHFMQWMCGETDEDHAAATIFNIFAAETTKPKIQEGS